MGSGIEQSNEIGIEFHDFLQRLIERPWRKSHPRWSDPRRTKGSLEKSALSCGEDPHRQCCELQTERANDRTADDPASNAACEKNEFHESAS